MSDTTLSTNVAAAGTPNRARELEIYRGATAPGATQEEVDFEPGTLAIAARSIRSDPAQDHPQDAPPSYQTPNIPVDAAGENTDRQDSDMKHIGHGIMLVLTAPIALAGMGVYACGSILEGTAMILKGAGSLGKKPMDYTRASFAERKPSRK